MGNHVVLDAVVNRAGDDAAIKQVGLGMVWPEAHDASGPNRCHAGDLQQLVERRVIDVRARLWWRGGRPGFGCSPRVSILVLSCPYPENAEECKRDNGHRHGLFLDSHGSILRCTQCNLQAG